MYDVKIFNKNGFEFVMKETEVMRIITMSRTLYLRKGNKELYIPIENIEYFTVDGGPYDNEQD